VSAGAESEPDVERFRGAGCQVSDVRVDSIYVQQRRRLLGLAAAITLDPGAAEEILHDAFVGLQRHALQVDNPEGYLQRSVINLAINRVRRRKVAAAHPPPPPPVASSPEIDETWAVVQRLPVQQRAVVVLRYWDDMTVEGIAETLGWPLGSVKSTLHRALRRLEVELR
jgi:RNA polymerase sigma factor (sigma-70 family)